MADEATLDSQHEHPNHPEPEGTPPRGGSNLGWIFVVAAIGALVYIPAVLTGDQGGWRSQQLTDTFTVTDMDHVPVTDVFADTPALEVTDVTPPEGAFLQVLVGHNNGSTNTYQLHTTSLEMPAELDGKGDLRVYTLTVNPVNDAPDIAGLNGGCCASAEGQVNNGIFNTAGTASGFNSQLWQVPTGAPTTVTVEPLPVGNSISPDFEAANSHFWAAPFNLTTDEVDIFATPSTGGPITLVGSVPCDSVYDGHHFGVTVSDDGDKAWVTCSNSGTVNVTQVRTVDGIPDWTHQLDTVPFPPSHFHYYECSLCGPIDLPDGSTGDALACSIPADDGLSLCMVGEVGLNAPPQWTQCEWFSGVSPGDRQATTCDGKMMYYHGPDLDGTGVRTIAVNCGNLDGPCSSEYQVDDGRTSSFASFAPNTAMVNGNPTKVIYDRQIIIEGNSSGTTYFTYALPSVHYNFENGTFNHWDGVSNGLPATPTPTP